jgi:hypothetical protein
MKYIAILTSDRTVFENFIIYDLNDDPNNKKYIQIKCMEDVRGREFEKHYTCYKWTDIPDAFEIIEHIERRTINQ